MMNWEGLILGAISVVGIIEWLKKFDSEKKFKKFYKFFPLVLSIIPAFLLSHQAGDLVWSTIFLDSIAILSISTLGYQTIIETIEKKIKNS